MKFVLALIALFTFPLFPMSLKDTAAAMAPGAWVKLSGTLDVPINDPGGIFAYANDAVWDPKTQQVLFLGDRTYLTFIRYDALNDQWHNDPNLPFNRNRTNCSGCPHSYENNAIDTSGTYYYMYYDSMYRYDTRAGAWLKALPHFKGPSGNDRFGSLVYFPEMNGMVYVLSGVVYLYDFGASAWSTLASGIDMGPYSNVAEYNPVSRIVVFGGGNGSTALYALHSDKTITPFPNAPESPGTGGNSDQARLTCDPASGAMLILSQTAFYGLKAGNSTWDALGTNPGIAVPFVSVPINTYGVVGFISYGTSTSNLRLAIYKHAASAGIVTRNSSRVRAQSFSAWPNPFRGRLSLSAPGAARIEIFNTLGKRVAVFKGEAGAWNAEGLSGGVYLARSFSSAGVFTKTLCLSR